MKYYVIYCDDGSPKMKQFNEKIDMVSWVTKFLFESELSNGSWIDYMFKGVQIDKSGKFEEIT